MIFLKIFFPQINDSVIVGRLDDGQDYKWIVPVDYITNLDEYKDSFIMNKTSSKLNIKKNMRSTQCRPENFKKSRQKNL